MVQDLMSTPKFAQTFVWIFDEEISYKIFAFKTHWHIMLLRVWEVHRLVPYRLIYLFTVSTYERRETNYHLVG